jgi:hypothetical protein
VFGKQDTYPIELCIGIVFFAEHNIWFTLVWFTAWIVRTISTHN